MAEADDSGDYQEKEKAKYHYRKKKFIHGKWRKVGTLIKQPEPYIGKGGVVITGEFKPEYKKRKMPKKYTNKYKRKKYE